MKAFGPLSADRDKNLLKYFHQTAFIDNLISYPAGEGPFLILSRPGAGKTAFKKWLLSDETEFVKFPLDADSGRVFVDDAQFNVEDYKTVLRAELLTCILSQVIDKKPKIPKKKDRTSSQEELNKAYLQAKKCLENSFHKWVSDFYSDRLASLEIFGFAFGLNKEERQKYLKKIRKNKVADKALEAIEEVIDAEDREFSLVVDNPEYIVGMGVETTDRENAIKTGALFNTLAEVHYTGMRVLSFTKIHILQSVQQHYTDYSHFADGIELFEWTADDLIKFVELRVQKIFQVEWANKFDLSKDEFLDQILPLLVNGPRDLLILLNKAVDNVKDSKITLDHLKDVTHFLRDEKYHEISRLYGGTYDGIDALCREAIRVVKSMNAPLTTKAVDDTLNSNISNPDTPLHGIRKSKEGQVPC